MNVIELPGAPISGEVGGLVRTLPDGNASGASDAVPMGVVRAWRPWRAQGFTAGLMDAMRAFDDQALMCGCSSGVSCCDAPCAPTATAAMRT